MPRSLGEFEKDEEEIMHHFANYVSSEIESVAGSLTCLCVYGGSPYGPSCTSLRNGTDAIIGTPGRIKVHYARRRRGASNATPRWLF